MTEQEERTSCVIPIWQKYTLSVQEAENILDLVTRRLERLLMNTNTTTLYCGMEQDHA